MINSRFLFLIFSCLILNLSFAQEFSKEETKWLAQPEFLIPKPKNNQVTKEEAESFRISIDVLLDANTKDEDRQLAHTKLSNERAGRELIDALKALVNKPEFQTDPRKNLKLRQLLFFINQNVLQTKNHENTLYLTQVYFELYVKGIVSDERLEAIPKKYLVDEYSRFKYQAVGPEEKLKFNELNKKISSLNQNATHYNLISDFHFSPNFYAKINNVKEYFEQTNPDTQKFEVMDHFLELYTLSYKMIQIKTNEGEASEFKSAPIIFRESFFSFPKKTLEKFYTLNPHHGAIELEKALTKQEYATLPELATKFFYSYSGNMAAFYSAFSDIQEHNWILALAKIQFGIENLQSIKNYLTDAKKLKTHTELETNLMSLGAFVALKLSDEKKFQFYVKALNNPKLSEDFFKELVGKNIPTPTAVINRYIENANGASGISNMFFALGCSRDQIMQYFLPKQEILNQSIKQKLNEAWVDFTKAAPLNDFISSYANPSKNFELVPTEYAFGNLKNLIVSDLFSKGSLAKAYVAGLRNNPEKLLMRVATDHYIFAESSNFIVLLDDIYDVIAKGPLDEEKLSYLAAIGSKIKADETMRKAFIETLKDKQDNSKLGALKIILQTYQAHLFGPDKVIHLLQDPNEEIRVLAAKTFYVPYSIPFNEDQLTTLQNVFKSEKSIKVKIELMRSMVAWRTWPETDVQVIQDALKSQDEKIVENILDFVKSDYFFDKKLFADQMKPYIQSKNVHLKAYSTISLIDLDKKHPKAELVKSLCESFANLTVTDKTRLFKQELARPFIHFDLETLKIASVKFVEIYKQSTEDAVKIEAIKGLSMLPKEALYSYEQFFLDLSASKEHEIRQSSAYMLSQLGSKAKLFLASIEKAKELDEFQLMTISYFYDPAVIPFLKKLLPTYPKEAKAQLFKSVSSMCSRQPLALDIVFHALDDEELKESALSFLGSSTISINVFDPNIQAKYIEKLKAMTVLPKELGVKARQALKVVTYYQNPPGTWYRGPNRFRKP